jgi:CDP-diacylglycerol--glycerol-3-phosphate 3-phosphatidyltransferase
MFKLLPNILTVLRIPLAGLFVYFLLQPGLENKILAAVFFSLAVITDFLDGYLARKYKFLSNFGKLMDPIADKVLTLSAFAVFAWMHLFPWWMFAVVCIREVGITVFRLWAGAQGVVLAAEKSGKWKTALQMMVIIGVLLFLILVLMNWIELTRNTLVFVMILCCRKSTKTWENT